MNATGTDMKTRRNIKLQERAPVREYGNMTERYLSITEIAKLWERSHPAVVKAFEDVEPDAIIGNVRGWKMETIDAVRKARPGRGNWGPRGAKTER